MSARPKSHTRLGHHLLTALLVLVSAIIPISIAPPSPAAAAGRTLITFSEIPVGTHVTNEYASKGIIFEGDDPFTLRDGANPSSPVLGTNRFLGAIGAKFVDPSDGVTPMTVEAFSLEAGFFDAVGGTTVEWFDLNGNKLGERTNSTTGIEKISIDGKGIASWRISITGIEPAGYAIDNVDFGDSIKGDSGPPPFVTVVQLASPNMVAAPNSIVTYTIVAVNRGRGSAKETTITLPIDPAQMKVLDVTTSRPATWVSNLQENSLEIKTGPLSSDGDTVTATLRLMTAPNLAAGTNLGRPVTYVWSDRAGSGSGSSNWPVLVAGPSAVNVSTYPISLVPNSAPVGTPLALTSNIFKPDEPVAIWFNTAAGEAVEIDRFSAAADGTLDVELTAVDLDPGYYSLVAQGIWSGIKATTPFQVQ